MSLFEIMRVRRGPITEPEMQTLEAHYGSTTGLSGFVEVAGVERLVRDNRRLRNLLLDYMDADGDEA